MRGCEADSRCTRVRLYVVGCVVCSDFKGNFPARATYAVKDLPKGAAVEIEAIATQ